ncbi:hypothetical protein [Accumulibacter sp.]|uniref:hypothetical protein n=1 Tax=Accumulibacter sp. TaxID=2053492 RepID=UPI0025DC4C07|nr:hypothetical protein [Accumulibacter sp.]MCM8594796.1 hypothetical protein [Accumulibacter sp.]MCM8625099.1 hypothetical protein [Accumulibacter sp.]MDS4048941.1 hypothetical protein [Accumulibacter sp.]
MDRIVRRYSAYFPRWCQAFGDHQPDPGGEGRAVEWLVGSESVGVILLPEVRHRLMRELLAERKPDIEFRPQSIRLNGREFSEAGVLRHAGYAALRELLLSREEVHMFLSYHLIYPSGTRILTASSRPPLPLLYKEMAALQIAVYE